MLLIQRLKRISILAYDISHREAMREIGGNMGIAGIMKAMNSQKVSVAID